MLIRGLSLCTSAAVLGLKTDPEKSINQSVPSQKGSPKSQSVNQFRKLSLCTSVALRRNPFKAQPICLEEKSVRPNEITAYLTILFIYICHKNVIYDIGTKILFLQQNDHNSTHKAPQNILRPVPESSQRDASFQLVKT